MVLDIDVSYRGNHFLKVDGNVSNFIKRRGLMK